MTGDPSTEFRAGRRQMTEKGVEIAPLIDHTLLKPDATREDVITLCSEARQYGFAAVCVNPSFARLAAAELLASAKPSAFAVRQSAALASAEPPAEPGSARLRPAEPGSDSPVKTCTTIGFPLGASTTETKVFEAENAIRNGAQELDMVLSIAALKDHNNEYVLNDIGAIVKAGQGCIVKVILETCLLTDEEKVTACKLAVKAGAHFVKTSTGFAASGATVEDIRLMRQTVGDKFGVKASGGMRSLDDVLKMIDAGATRIGTSSSVAIVT